MIRFLSRRLLSSPPSESPTTSLYFCECMREEIGPEGSMEHPIWRLSPNVFYVPRAHGPCALVVRDSDSLARNRLARLPRAQLRYLIDDDPWAGSADSALPWAYRRRLSAMAGRARQFMAEASRIYVPSAHLKEKLAGYETTLVQPGLILPPADLVHHDEAGLRIVFAGTRSHRRDLEMIARPLALFLTHHADCRLETFLGRYAPRALRLPNVMHHAPQSWAQYRSNLVRGRYHIALAPARPTDFNAARSHSKLLEFACFGAAPICSSHVPFANLVEEAKAGFLCRADADGWYDMLCLLHENRNAVREAAEANIHLAMRIGDLPALRAFWRRELGLAMPSASDGKQSRKAASV